MQHVGRRLAGDDPAEDAVALQRDRQYLPGGHVAAGRTAPPQPNRGPRGTGYPATTGGGAPSSRSPRSAGSATTHRASTPTPSSPRPTTWSARTTWPRCTLARHTTSRTSRRPAAATGASRKPRRRCAAGRPRACCCAIRRPCSTPTSSVPASGATDGPRRVRRGYFARLRLSPFEDGEVLPHERTMAGPKAERLALLQATRTNVSPILVISSGDTDAASALLAGVASREPAFAARDGRGDEHRLWVIDDPSEIARLVEAPGAAPVLNRRRPPPLRDGARPPRGARRGGPPLDARLPRPRERPGPSTSCRPTGWSRTWTSLGT